jgi:uncharacterized membrane protein YbhN (UPF0104 family)
MICTPSRALRRSAIRHWSGPAVATIVVAAALVSPELRRAPSRLLAACTAWITIGFVFESLSIVGFVLIFKLAFGGGMSWGRSVVAAFRGLGASGLLPAGGLIGPAAAASSVDIERRRDQMARSAIAFVIVTNVPGVVVVIALGAALAFGLGGARHDVPLTLAPAGVGLALAAATVTLARGSRSRDDARRPAISSQPTRWVVRGLSVARGGAADACSLLRAANWKLLGAVGYYVFDNTLLWAAFRAGGHAPAVSVVAMGYVVGSLGTALPLPAGIGATEGGLIGALVLYGAPVGPSTAAVLLYRAVTLALSTLLGAAAWGTLPVRRRRRTTVGNDHHDQHPSCVTTSPASSGSGSH